MATSGTISQTVFTTRQIIDHAYRRCRMPAQAITGEMIDIARDVLYLMLSDWANNNIQLWCIEKLIIAMYEGQAQLPLPIGTVDILNANIRQVTQQNTEEIQIVPGLPNQYTFDFGLDPTDPARLRPNRVQIPIVGLTFAAGVTPPLMSFQTSDDNVTYQEVLSVTPKLYNGRRWWADIDGSLPKRYFRVQSPTGTTITSLITNYFLANNPTEITIARLNRDDYINLPNKTFQGRPLQYWYDRQRDNPIMTLWPAPSSYYAEQQQLTVWRKRYIMDVGSSQQTLDIPQRWYEAVVSNLADRLAGEVQAVPVDILPILNQKAMISLMKAQAEERDSSPIYWSPNIGVYTR